MTDLWTQTWLWTINNLNYSLSLSQFIIYIYTYHFIIDTTISNYGWFEPNYIIYIWYIYIYICIPPFGHFNPSPGSQVSSNVPNFHKKSWNLSWRFIWDNTYLNYTISPYITYETTIHMHKNTPSRTCCMLLWNIVKLGTPYKRDDSFYRPLVPELLVAQMLWLFRVRWS